MQGEISGLLSGFLFLLDQDCNGKMVECPQCGHALMNARNRSHLESLESSITSYDLRTAELLAVKLGQLRGDTVKSVMASQALNISVTHPQKVCSEDER